MLNHMSGWFYLRPAFNGNSVSDDTSLHDPNKKWRVWSHVGPKTIDFKLIYIDEFRGLTNTTITVLRVPASVSEYGWMLEKRHFVYM